MKQTYLLQLICSFTFCVLFIFPSMAKALAPRTEEESAIIKIYKDSNKSVVNITSKASVVDFFGPSYREGSGSGVIIDSQKGLILTNYHVISEATLIDVTLGDGKSFRANIRGKDPNTDLALLEIPNPPKDLQSTPLGESSSLEVGQRVLAIGNPFGLNRTLTTGIVSSLGRTIKTKNGRLIEDIIQIDADINPGNSGGPLLDTAGQIVGINTAIVSSTGDSSGIGFAIPVNEVKRVLPDLLEFGYVRRPKIGAIISDTEYGPVVLYVHPGSPAEEAGLRGARRRITRGYHVGYIVDISGADFILGVGKNKIRSRAEIVEAIEKTKEGETLSLVVHNGKNPLLAPRKVKIKPRIE